MSMMSVIGPLALSILVGTVQAGSPTCEYSYNAYGDFIFSGSTWASCTLTLNKWAGVDMSATTFSMSDAIFTRQASMQFIYGLPYVFSFSTGCGDCSSETYTITPEVCSNTISRDSYMKPWVRPDQHILPIVRYPPTGSSNCYYIVTDKTTPSTPGTSSASSCSAPPLMSWDSSGSVTTTKTWYVSMAYYASTPASLLAVQPTCGVSDAVVETTLCSVAPSFSLASWSSLRVTISSIPDANFKCLVTLTKWSGNTANPVVSKISSDCTSVVFSSQDTGSDFSDSSANGFSAEYYKYANDKDLDIDNPDCFRPPSTSGGSLRPTTLASGSAVRVDPGTVRVTMNAANAYTFGVCEVRLTATTDADDVPSVPLSRFGPCGGSFDFIVDGLTIMSYSGNTVLTFSSYFYQDGNVLSTPSVSTSTGWTYTIPNSAYSCPSLSVTESPTGTYTFTVASPKPVSGGCALDFGANDAAKRIPWPGCDTLQINYYDMKKIDSAVAAPGTSFNLKYYYYPNGYSSTATSTCSSSTVTNTIYINYGLVLSSATSTSFTFNLGTPTSPPTGVSNYYGTIGSADVSFYGCGGSATLGTVVGTPQSFTGFTSNDEVTVTDVSITAGNTCYFALKVTKSGDSAFSGYSGYVAFVAAGPPSWSGVSPPRVMLYGSDCVRLVWTKVADPTNAPVTCYLVLEAHGTASISIGTASVVRPCSDSNALVTDNVYCSISSTPYYQFTVNAVNRQGSSSISTTVFQLSDLQADETLTYDVTVDSTSNKFTAGTFPILSIEWAPSVTPPTDLFIPRLLVGVLTNLATLDSSTHTVPEYTSSNGLLTGPLSWNQAFPFVETYTFRVPSSGSTAYMYDLIVPTGTVTLAGQYSVITYALQGSGLRGQYWTGTTFSGSTMVERVDPELNYDWGTGSVFAFTANTVTTQVYDLFSVRWTGFIEAAFSELYTFYIETHDQVMLWIDNVPVISKWTNVGPCSGVCTGQHLLSQSVLSSSSNVGERKFHHLRIEAIHARGAIMSQPAMMKLSWSSNSQAKEIIPSERMFAGYPIHGSANPNAFTLPNVVIEPGALTLAATAVSVTSTLVSVGDTFYVNITTKDSYGNTVPTTNEQFKVGQNDGTTTANDYAIATPNSPGSYFVPIEWDATGTLTLTVTRETTGSSVTIGVIPVTVIAGAVTQLTMDSPPSITAGVDFSLTFKLKDAQTNLVTITSTMDLSPIAITATWTGDSALGLVTPDDTVARLQRYSTTFNPTSITPSVGSSTVTAVMNLPFSGSYSLTFVFGDNDSNFDTLTGVVANSASVSAEYTIVTTSPFPPSELVVDSPQLFVIQLRDSYMNPIEVPVTGLAVYGRIGSETSSSCDSDGSLVGTYTCTITPQVAGSNLPLSIKVGGNSVSYLQEGPPVKRIQGPWLVTVLPGAYDADSSIVQGLQAIYTVGESYDISIVLYDSYGNALGAAPSTCPPVSLSVQVGSSTDSYSFLTPTCNGDGTISFAFSPTIPRTSAALSINVDGTNVNTIPSSLSTSIKIIAGFASASGSTCTLTTTSPQLVGTSVTMSCTPYDLESNTPTSVPYDLYAATYMRHQVDKSILVNGTMALSSGAYSNSADLDPTIAGNYDFYVELGQPGGLIAQYYEFDDFTQVIGTSTGVLTATKFVGDPELRYTRIDTSINFDWSSEGVSIGGVSAAAVKWYGYVYFPTGTTTVTLAGSGEVYFELDGVEKYDNFGTPSDVTPAPYTVTAAQKYSIVLQFKPTAANPKLSLKYTASSSTWVIPPMYFSSPLPVPSSAISGTNPIDFDAGVISDDSSQISFPYDIIAGQSAIFHFYPRDAYGNNLDESSCNDIIFSLLDSDGNPTLWSSAFTSGANTTACSSLSAISNGGYVGSTVIQLEATDYSIVASVTYTTGSFTLQIDHVDISSPS